MDFCSTLCCKRRGKKRFKSTCENCEQHMYACSTLHHTMLSHVCTNCKIDNDSKQIVKEGGGIFAKVEKI